MPLKLPGAAYRRRLSGDLPDFLLVPVLTLVLIGLSLPASAQERSDTGRRKPPAPPRPAPAAKPAEARPQAPGFSPDGPRWQFGFAGGLADGGDLFRAETTDGTTAAWGTAGVTRFRASRFTAKVDAGASLSVQVARRLGDGRWWLRGEVSRGGSDIAAEALQGQGGEVFLYDRLSVLGATVGAEARLTSWPSHPYLSFGLTAARLDADREAALDQTGLGGQAALGYRQRIGRGFVAIESQVRRIAIDLSAFQPSLAESHEQGVICTPAEELWLFELRVVGSRAW